MRYPMVAPMAPVVLANPSSMRSLSRGHSRQTPHSGIADSPMRVMEGAMSPKHYLLASDFDQTLSFNDSGILLSEMLGMGGFVDKCAGLSSMHLVHQGAELSYLLLHDPEYRRVRKEDLQEVGRRIRLKQNIAVLSRLLDSLAGFRFTFCVISAAPRVGATAMQLAALSWQRAANWAGTAPVIHCGPAPLTERPGSAAELARPHVIPLEAAFLDAVTLRRTLAANAGLGDR